MPIRGSNRRQWRSFWLAIGLSMAAGCSAGAGNVLDVDLTAEESLRLGRVHVVFEPNEGDSFLADEDRTTPLQVTARFAFVRGLDEDLARARANMPLLPQDLLSPSECMSDGETATDNFGPRRGEPRRELVLLDAGDLQVEIGTTDLAIPLSLVPDLLPYMSGVEYVYRGETVRPRSDEGVRVLVDADGSDGDDLPPFTVRGMVPPELELFAGEDDRGGRVDGALVLRWNGTSDGALAVRLTPLAGGEPTGDPITCLFNDGGQTRIDLSILRSLGLHAGTDALRVTASRSSTTTFDAGDFVGSELVIERRAQQIVDLRRPIE